MKLRITPLNFATAFLTALAVYIWVYGASVVGGPYQQVHLAGQLVWIFLLFAFVVFVIDLMFRNYFPETKRLWIVEVIFLLFIAIIFLLVKK